MMMMDWGGGFHVSKEEGVLVKNLLISRNISGKILISSYRDNLVNAEVERKISDVSSSSSSEEDEPKSKRSRRKRKEDQNEELNPRRKKLNAAELEKIDAAAAVGDDTVFKWADYFGENNTLFVVDAKKKGNVGRFLNHSCDPNVQVQHVFVDTHDLRLPWSSFFAIRNIKAGEVPLSFLLCSYDAINFLYFFTFFKMKSKLCRN
ncbi:unnamed protein product [Strongylus vulgaris]|uniref:SET domain-containing protein n=1 Tax=Strongylus vulgaris TaxID=40348 RepID=A0A3P7J1A9_STRVU|nr:unnamed protein product [Strongylus vulgaris]